MTPFAVLGLPPSRELTDDDVRSAWRRIAAATHPDRADGGDPEAFAAAAAAYTLLRTASGRGEALAAQGEGPARAGRPALRLALWRTAWRVTARLVVAAAAVAVAVVAIGWQPASVAILTGVLTWLALAVRHDVRW